MLAGEMLWSRCESTPGYERPLPGSLPTLGGAILPGRRTKGYCQWAAAPP
jgi:hypothetical protein